MNLKEEIEKTSLENENQPSCLGAVSGSVLYRPEGSGKKVFNDFWEISKKDNCDRKTLASIAFDAGHLLRHEQPNSTTLIWIKKESTFNYSGKKVTRTRLTVSTILGDLIVYEAVSGNCYYQFFNELKVIRGDYEYRNFGQVKREKVESLEEGIMICEAKWSRVKEIINSI